MEAAFKELVTHFTKTNKEFRNGSSGTHINVKFNGMRLPGDNKNRGDERGLREAISREEMKNIGM